MEIPTHATDSTKLELNPPPLGPSKPKKSFSKVFFYVFLGYVTLILTAFAVGYFSDFFEITESFIGHLREIFKTHPFTVYISFYLITMGLSIVMIPVLITMGSILLMISDSRLISCMLILFTIFSIHVTLYFLIKLNFSWFESQVENSNLLSIVAEQNRKKPWLTAFALRFLLLPTGVIDVILVSVDCPFHIFFVTSFIKACIVLLDANNVSLQTAGIVQVMAKISRGEPISLLEVLRFVFFAVMSVVTVTTSFMLSIWFKRKLTERKHEQEIKEKIKEMEASQESPNRS